MRGLRVFLGAFGDAGHAFPMIALGARLSARGHDVTLETWKRWREHVEAAGMRFVAAPEYPVFPTAENPLGPYEAVHVVGPLMWEPPYHEVEGPSGSDPLVLVAPSTAQDPEHRLLRAALVGLAREPIGVLATWNRRRLRTPVPVPANTRLVEWVS